MLGIRTSHECHTLGDSLCKTFGNYRAFTLTFISLHEVGFCEGSGILPCLQANELDCHYFMDTGGIQETPTSETENFITHNTASSMSMGLASIPHPP